MPQWTNHTETYTVDELINMLTVCKSLADGEAPVVIRDADTSELLAIDSCRTNNGIVEIEGSYG